MILICYQSQIQGGCASAVCPNLPLTRLSRKGEFARSIVVVPLKFARRGERVRYAVRREAAHERSRSTAPVGLRRMRELRNCHIKGNFVPAGGTLLWCRRDKRHNAVTPFATNYNATTLPSQLCCATLPCTGRAKTPTVTALPRHLPQRGRQGYMASPLSIPSARKVAFRCGTQFAHTCAFAERLKAAMLYCCHLSPPKENTRSAAGASAGCLSNSRLFLSSV